MILIALDTALGACSVAVLDTATDALLAEASEPMERGHAERLMPMVAEVLAAAGLRARDGRRFVATVGPGSFTGLRVAIAAARAMALASGGEAVGISTLEALAAPHRASGRAVAAAVDARHDHVYMRLTGPDGREIVPAAYLPAGEAARMAAEAGPAVLVGSGAEVLAAAWPAGAAAPALVDRAASPAIAAVARLGAGADAALHPARPLYLKAVDAKPQAPAPFAAARP